MPATHVMQQAIGMRDENGAQATVSKASIRAIKSYYPRYAYLSNQQQAARSTDAGLKSGFVPYWPHGMHAYPDHLVKPLLLRDGTRVMIRPIRAEDADIEQAFVRGLSDESRYFRFMDMLRELSPQMLKQLTDIDYDNQMALIAVIERDGKESEIAVGRYVVFPDGENCEFAVVVGDDWQGKGIATALMRALIESARRRGRTR